MKWLTGPLVLLVVLGITATPALAQMAAADRQALIDLYHATDGDNWNNNDGWLGPAGTECQWYGVDCHGNTWVRNLWLANNGLSGPVPAAIFRFRLLQEARLNRNELTGPLPEGIPSSSATQVTLINLSDNLIDGVLPAAWGQRDDLRELRLSGNRIVGGIPENWIGMTALTRLDLDDNLLDGNIAPLFAMPALEWLGLSGNRLESLPESVPDTRSPTRRLVLNDNLITGELPDWFAELSVAQVGLAGNQLSGTIDLAVAAIAPEGHLRRLWLDHNRFEDPIPSSIINLEMPNGSVDLCWNRFEQFEPDLLPELHRIQVAGNPQLCNMREFVDLDLSISGSWYVQERAGEGYSLMALDNGLLLAYWFGFPQSGMPGDQQWVYGLNSLHPDQTVFNRMVLPRFGQFGQGLGDTGMVAQPSIYHHIRAVVEGHLYIYTSWPMMFYGHIPSPPPPPVLDRQDFKRLTHLAGTTCDNQHPEQWISGAWYESGRNGEGFMIEVLDSGKGLVYWFTFAPEEAAPQVWMIGVGQFDGSTLHIDDMSRPTGGGFRHQFNPGAVEFTHWGSLTMEFHDDLNGHVWFDSVDEDYGSGDYPIQRLARPKLAECE